jgi:hypothetical protein
MTGPNGLIPCAVGLLYVVELAQLTALTAAKQLVAHEVKKYHDSGER